MTDTWVVGDVHGCADELDSMLRQIDAEGPARVVLVGDLYTKGPDPAGVWQRIHTRQLEAVLGNHDARLLARLDGRRPHDHHADEVLRTLDATSPAWRQHLRSLPLFLEVDGWTVVHASIHPSGDLDQTRRKDFISRRRVPHDRAPHPFWWSAYHGERRVVFGHDAARGLVLVHRQGKRLLAGLDTGCVYGGALTAMRLRDGALKRVPARRAYRQVRGAPSPG